MVPTTQEADSLRLEPGKVGLAMLWTEWVGAWGVLDARACPALEGLSQLPDECLSLWASHVE